MQDKDALILENLYESIYSDMLLLEADRRGVIKRDFKMSQEIADYLHNFNQQLGSDKYSDWLARFIKKMPAYNEAENKEEFVRSLSDDISRILHFFHSNPKINVSKYDWQTALAGDVTVAQKEKGAKSDVISFLEYLQSNNYGNTSNLYLVQLNKAFKEFNESPDKVSWFKQNIENKIPDDLRRYLIETTRKAAIWFMYQIPKIHGYQEARNKLDFVNVRLGDDITNISDWLNSRNAILTTGDVGENAFFLTPREVPDRTGQMIIKTPWMQAIEKANSYHRVLAMGGNRHKKGPETHEIVIEYKDNDIFGNLYWCDLKATYSEEEHDLMGHCGANAIPGGTLMSLRSYDPEKNKIVAYITTTVVRSQHMWIQTKGRDNSATSFFSPNEKVRDQAIEKNEPFMFYIADLYYKLDLYQKGRTEQSHNEIVDIQPNDLIKVIKMFKDKFPNADEFIEKVRKHGKMRSMDKELRELSVNFTENGFNELDDDEKEAYISRGYYIPILSCIENLSDELKTIYKQKLVEDPERAKDYLILKVNEGDGFNDFDPDILKSVTNSASATTDLVLKFLQKNNDNFDEIPKSVMSGLGSVTNNNRNSKSDDLTVRYFKYLLIHKKEDILDIDPNIFKAISSTGPDNFKIAMDAVFQSGQADRISELQDRPNWSEEMKTDPRADIIDWLECHRMNY
jgi:hypothetical protein